MTMIWREIPVPVILEATDGKPVATVRIVGTKSIALFKEMVRRANNCWDTAPVEMKEFSDMVTEGRLLQDYAGTTDFVKKEVSGQ